MCVKNVVLLVLIGAGAVPTTAAERFAGETLVLPVRVHLGRSGRSEAARPSIFPEINRIWGSQAAICFDFEPVVHDRPLQRGFDLWFAPEAGGYNGYYADRHEIRVRDFPELRMTAHPAVDPAARTAAHELGHALGLPHRQTSDDNLMRSKTQGWRLNDEEIRLARKNAATDAAVRRSDTCAGGAGGEGEKR